LSGTPRKPAETGGESARLAGCGPGGADAGKAVELSAGRVGRPHGLDGSFYVTRPRARLLSHGTAVRVGGQSRPIVRRAGTEQRPILRLAGIEDRAGVELLRGMDLTIADADAPALEEGEWWSHELEGCEVYDGEQRVGVVTRLIELPSCEALEVQADSGGEPLLVPMVRDAIRAVEPSRGRVEIDLAFLGLDAPRAEGTS
jgi:16S rRNA processing protein RimM